MPLAYASATFLAVSAAPSLESWLRDSLAFVAWAGSLASAAVLGRVASRAFVACAVCLASLAVFGRTASLAVVPCAACLAFPAAFGRAANRVVAACAACLAFPAVFGRVSRLVSPTVVGPALSLASLTGGPLPACLSFLAVFLPAECLFVLFYPACLVSRVVVVRAAYLAVLVVVARLALRNCHVAAAVVAPLAVVAVLQAAVVAQLVYVVPEAFSVCSSPPIDCLRQLPSGAMLVAYTLLS